MLNVIAARWGTGFKDYAERLESMVARNLTVPHKFHCFEEQELRDYAPQRFWQYPSPYRPTLFRGYPLLFCFNPKLPIEGRTLFLGLDVVITDNLDELVSTPGEFIAIKDWWQPNFNNSVMLYDAGAFPQLFDSFPGPNAENETEQDWIAKWFPLDGAHVWPQEWVRSYKGDCRGGMIPNGCKAVIFHGQPKNHEVKDNWVRELWQ